MKNKTLLAGIIGIMLVLGTANAQNFSKSFNMDYPVYGFDLLGYAKSPTISDLTLPDNFLNTGNQRVTCEEAHLNDHGAEYTIKLLLSSGITRVARMEVKFKTDARTGRNYPIYISLYDFSTRRTEKFDYRGREQMLERLITRYVELLDMFYNKSRLLS